MIGAASAGDVRLTPAHERLWRWLWANARGRAAAVPRRRILMNLENPASDVGRTFCGMTDRRFRKLADDLCDAGFPAWANESGYYAGQDVADLLEYRRYLAAKARSILRRGHRARYALEAQRARVAGDPKAFQTVAEPTPERPRRRILEPVGPVKQPGTAQQVLL